MGAGLFLELAGIFWSGLIFGKMLFRSGGECYTVSKSPRNGLFGYVWVGGGGGARRPYFDGNQGGNQTIPGFWAVSGEDIGRKLAGFFRLGLIFRKMLCRSDVYVIPF